MAATGGRSRISIVRCQELLQKEISQVVAVEISSRFRAGRRIRQIASTKRRQDQGSRRDGPRISHRRIRMRDEGLSRNGETRGKNVCRMMVRHRSVGGRSRR